MDKKILALDDNLRVQEEVEAYIRKQNPRHEVALCGDCSCVLDELEAQTILGQPPFDLFILDLNVNTIGLNIEQASKTQNGLRTGWVLLMDILLPRDKENLNKVVIFSGWLRQLEAYVGSNSANLHEKEVFEHLRKNGCLLSKTAGYDTLRSFL